MAATFDRLSGGRLLINLVTGGDQTELEGDGVFLDHAERYEQSPNSSASGAKCWRAATPARRFDFDGEHLQRQGRQAAVPAAAAPYPPVFFGGSSAAAHELAASRSTPT
jgi:alkanesulfonate monooxygenase